VPIGWIEVAEADLEECLNVEPLHIGRELVGEAEAKRGWRELLDLPSFIAGSLVRPHAQGAKNGRGRQIVGFAAACFVSSQFTDAELADPRPGTVARFMECFVTGRPILLNRAEIARSNAGEGVDILQIYGTLRPVLSQLEEFEAVALMWSKFSEYCNGHRVRRVILEVTSDSERRFTRGSGVKLIEFAEANRCLACATRGSVADVPSSAGLAIFVYQEPVLRLRETDQELLLAAINGATDEEIGLRLGLSQNTVKARWRSALARIGEARPDLVACDNRGEGRGPQKRHRILAYVRDHFEELRPYDWRTRNRRSSRAAISGD
jgi:DNA-binding CsgD family transcriptional regulator